MNFADLTEEQKRKLLLTPVESKAALRMWVQQFLAIDLPDGIVDPTSNSSPMSFLWELYSQCALDEPEYTQYLAYASRDSFKTLITAIIEVLAVLHLGRSVVHLAAILDQAKKAQSYVRGFFARPLLIDFMTSDAERSKTVSWWETPKGDILTDKEFGKLRNDDPRRQDSKRHACDIVIVVATLKSVNGQHAPFVVVDELDVMDDASVYEESKMIPTILGRKLPITLITSTRKFSHGLVQKEIDNSEQRGIAIRHWNLIDVTETCPPHRVRRDLPIVDLAFSEETLETVSKAAYDAMSPDRKVLFREEKAAHGCLKNCKLYAACRGRLPDREPVPKIKGAARLVKPVAHTQSTIGKMDIDKAKAQYLCWKPSTYGNVYPNLDREIHEKTAAEMYEMLTGEECPIPDMRKDQLVAMFAERGAKCYAGQDYGFTHMFSTVTGWKDGHRLFIIDCIAQAELEIEQCIEVCNGRIKEWQPHIIGDSENPEAIRKFRRAGYSISPVKKGPGSVLGGIEQVRAVLRPGLGAPPMLYFLKGDPGVDYLLKQMAAYHWKLDGQGEPSKEPDDKDDDSADACRYLIVGAFGGGKIVVSKDTPAVPGQAPTKEVWLQQQVAQAISQRTGIDVIDMTGAARPEPIRQGKKGRILWST